MSQRYQITLNSGRDIYLDQLYQYRTYAGLSVGYPTPSHNEKVIQRALEYTKEKLWCQWGKPFLLIPTQTPIDLSDAERDRYLTYTSEMPSKLPEVVCLANFESFEPARDKAAMGSTLGIVWFQDGFGLPSDEIVEQIKSIDWDSSAFDHDGD
ncbi:MAG: hypothetical protein PHN45_11160 [Methylococcales bacterium]|nr:hypothetical protein [Methylococcales bacterium]MDD5755294.1 hypothetical protein [Methylococcales bacterium]